MTRGVVGVDFGSRIWSRASLFTSQTSVPETRGDLILYQQPRHEQLRFSILAWLTKSEQMSRWMTFLLPVPRLSFSKGFFWSGSCQPPFRLKQKEAVSCKEKNNPGLHQVPPCDLRSTSLASLWAFLSGNLLSFTEDPGCIGTCITSTAIVHTQPDRNPKFSGSDMTCTDAAHLFNASGSKPSDLCLQAKQLAVLFAYSVIPEHCPEGVETQGFSQMRPGGLRKTWGCAFL